MKNTLDQHRNALAEQQMENLLLRDILAAHGISFQAELENRKAAMMAQHQNGSFAPSTGGSRSGSYGQASRTGMSSSSRSPPSAIGQKFNNNVRPSISGMSTGSTSFHGHSSAEPGISERAVKQEQVGVPDMPGVFERDQQLGIDFILA